MSTPTRKFDLTEALKYLRRAARKAKNRTEIDSEAIEAEIVELLSALRPPGWRDVIDADETDEAEIWDELADEPGDTDLAMRLKLISEADDPFREDLNLISSADRASLNRVARVMISTHHKDAQGRLVRTLPFVDRLEVELKLFRQLAKDLAHYHKNSVRPGAHRKQILDRLLLGLADVFVSHAGLDCHWSKLPHSTGSHFIRFARAAIKPFFDLSATSNSAPSKRWKRLKDEEGAVIP